MIKLFSLATKRMLSSAYYKSNFCLKRAVKPLFINFPITYLCNSRCVMCAIWKKYNNASGEIERRPQDELKLKDIADFVKNNKGFLSDLKSIGITGGEAFLRDDIVEIIRGIHRELPWVDLGVQTNGLLPDLIKAKIKEILKFYPNFKIAVSLDGLDIVHDRMRGINGAYEKAIQTIRYANELGLTGITCGMTLTTDNFDKILEVAQKVESLGCEFSCFFVEKSEYFGNKQGNRGFSAQQLNTISGQLEKFRHHYFMDNLRIQISGLAKRTLPCFSGYTSYVINPYGDILPCILAQDSFGNIKQGLFKDIVSSDDAWQIRKKLKNCKCWCQCEVSTSAMVWPFDVLKWFLKNKNKVEIIGFLNKKTLIGRL